MKCNVDTVSGIRDKRGARVRAARPHEVAQLVADAASSIGGALADPQVVLTVLDHDPDSVWAFERNGELVGGVAFLFLSADGVAALAEGRLDPRQPDLRWLVRADQKPAGIYIWALLGKGRAAAPLSHGFVRLREARYAQADLWALPFSAAGQRFTIGKGFEPVSGHPGLYRFRRLAAQPATVPED